MARCAGGARMWSVRKLTTFQARHPELVSGSIVPHSPPVAADRWTLKRQSPTVKRVQGDDVGFEGDGFGFAG